MAALMRHGVFKIVRTTTTTNASTARTITSAYFDKNRKKRMNVDKRQPPKIDSTRESIAAKGFLRPQKAYIPPTDVEDKLKDVFQRVVGSTNEYAPFESLHQKFLLCSACAKELNHSIPNSLLHTIETLDDVRKFYQTPVNTTTPLDMMRHMDLPENLHVQFEYNRFHPETDTMFGGQTAFNRSSTLVTGLKYKDKYKGHVQSDQWPFNS